MIGSITIRVSAGHPNMPVGPIAVIQGSACTVGVLDVPKSRFGCTVDSCTVSVTNAEGETESAQATLTGGVWSSTFPSSHFASPGTVECGITVLAGGKDADGTARTWIIGQGDVEIISSDGVPASGESWQNVHLRDTQPTTATKGDICKISGNWKIYDGASWQIIGGSGGTTDYTALTNKPSINNVTLTGNRSLADIGAQPALASDGSDIPGGPYLPKSGGLINGDLSVGEEYDGSRNFKVGSPSGAKGFHVETTSDGCVLRVGGSEGSGGSVVVEDGGIGFASIKKGGKEVAIEEQLPYPIASAFMVDDDVYQLSDRTVNTFDASGSFVFPAKVGTSARDFVLVITAGETAPSVSFPGTGVTYVGEGADAFTAEANKTNIWWFSEVGANVFSVSHKAWSTITQGS